MVRKQEEIRATVPAGNKWHTEDVDKAAEALELSRSQFILLAVDMLVSFDPEFFNEIQRYAKGLMLPEYVVIQNTIIKRKAQDRAHREVWGGSEILDEFISTADDDGKLEIMTGAKLEKALFDTYILKERQEKTKFDAAVARYDAVGKTIID